MWPIQRISFSRTFDKTATLVERLPPPPPTFAPVPTKVVRHSVAKRRGGGPRSSSFGWQAISAKADLPLLLRYHLRMKFPITLIALSFAAVCALPAGAQQQRANAPAAAANTEDPASKPTPRLADGHPDLNGFWAIGRGPDTPVGSGFGERNPNVKRGEARNAAAQYADPNQPPYKPELTAKVQDLAKNESKVDTAFFCKPGGVPRIGPPHAIVQAPGMPIVLLYEVNSGNTFRLVPTDGRAHDPNRSE